jgi:hypothetical protein
MGQARVRRTLLTGFGALPASVDIRGCRGCVGSAESDDDVASVLAGDRHAEAVRDSGEARAGVGADPPGGCWFELDATVIHPSG